MFCDENSCDGLFLDILGLEDRIPRAIFASLVAFAATKAGAVIIPAWAALGSAAINALGNMATQAIVNRGVDRDGNSLTQPKCSDFLNGMGGTINILETD